MANQILPRQVIRSESPRIDFRPVIREIIRTQVCPPDLTLLVDRIHVTSYVVSGQVQEAYRLWLSDGEKTIQAVLRSEIHPYVTSKAVQSGSFISISNYQLAESKRLNGNGSIRYLQINELEPVGSATWDPRPLVFEEQVQLPEKSTGQKRPDVHTPTPEPGPSSSRSSSVSLDNGGENTTDEIEPQKSFSRPISSEPNNVGLEAGTEFAMDPSIGGHISGPSTIEGKYSTEPSQVFHARTQTQPPSKASGDTSRPLKLSPLSNLIGPKVPRNRVHDIFAAIWSIEPNVVKRRGMPAQRHLRLIDSSMTKKVQLTVFVDAENFLPKVGTVALFKGVTTHEWDGGSLKAYPRDCAGRQWYIPNPVGIEGCDSKALRSLFLERWAEEVASMEEKITPDQSPK